MLIWHIGYTCFINFADFFFLFFKLTAVSLIFHLLNFLWLWIQVKQLPTGIVKGCCYVGASLCRLHVSSAFDRRAAFDVDASHTLLKVCWQLSPLWGRGLEVQGLQLELAVRWDFLSAQWPSMPYCGWDLVPQARALVGSVPFKWKLSPLPAAGILPQGRWSVEGREVNTDSWLLSAIDKGPSCLSRTACASNCFPCFTQIQPQVRVSFVPHRG